MSHVRKKLTITADKQDNKMTAVIIEQDIFVMHRAEEMHNLFVLAP